MENSNLRRRILSEMENLIAQSCSKQQINQNFELLHIHLLKKHYNAANVSMDYHRKRVKMDLVLDDTDYDPKTINLHMPTLYVNLWFRDLRDFMMSCIDLDSKSLAFYARLIWSFEKEDKKLLTA